MKSYLLSVLAILICAVPSAWLAWTGMRALGLEGVTLAVATAIGAMVMALGLFSLLAALGKRFKITL